MSQALTRVDPTQLLWQRYAENPADPACRNHLVKRYLPLVQHHAHRLRARMPDSVDVNDLVSAGVFGLIDAIRRFDASRDVKFETFCARRIRGAMLDELRATDWVPRAVRSSANELAKFNELQFIKTGRKLTDCELAEAKGLNAVEFQRLSQSSTPTRVTSLNKERSRAASTREVSEGCLLADAKAEDPTRRLKKKDLVRLVTKGLDKKERLIILLYYYEELTMRQIGETLGLSESRVSQMHGDILERLRAKLAERELEFAA